MKALTITQAHQLPDAAILMHLPGRVRKDVEAWVPALAAVKPPIGEAMRLLGRQMGVSPASARRRFDQWRVRGWEGLINRAICKDWDTASIHPDTVEHWRKLVVANQRKCRPAYRMLVRQFLAGEPIPGVGPEVDRSKMPRGWSYANLMKRKPDEFTVAAFRIGKSRAVSDHGPLVFTSRADLWVGSHYMFDDLWHDHMVNVLDRAKTGRPLEFHGLDLFSACKVAWGIRVRTENEVTGKHEGLKEQNMRFLVASLLAQDGYSERGTQMVVEHGTAAIHKELERRLYDLTGGKITVRRSGVEGDPAHIGQFHGRGGGNFRFKAALESLGNLVHNEMGFITAQTGRKWDEQPEELHEGRGGLLHANRELVRAFHALAVEKPQVAQLLRFPVLSNAQFLLIAQEVYHRINTRTDHELEGWDLMVRPDERDPSRVRRMSPWEVWTSGRQQLTRLRPEAVAALLYQDSAEEVRVRRGVIEWLDKEIAADALVFDARTLIEGEKYQAVLNPFHDTNLFLFRADGRYAGMIPRIRKASRADDNSLVAEHKRVSTVLADRLAPVAALGREMAQQRIADMRHNAEALAQLERNTPAVRAARQAERDRAAGAAMAGQFEPISSPDPVTEHGAPVEVLTVRGAETEHGEVEDSVTLQQEES